MMCASPEKGVLSVVAEHPNGRKIEIGLVGCEGMTGTAVVLDSDRSPHSTYFQVAGEAYRMPAAALRRAIEQSPSLHAVLMKYVQAFMVQTAHTAIANARATIDVRLARWLLMAQDRVRDNKLPMTHEFLALMLGVRRAGVTEALQSLVREKLITTERGVVVILNRKGLERTAGDAYGTPEAEFRRLIG